VGEVAVGRDLELFRFLLNQKRSFMNRRLDANRWPLRSKAI